jgi:polyhydroxyalkanoate synthesis regulator phasin
MDELIHLHADYSNSFCGQDASHIPMTYALGETTCAACKDALAAKREELKSQEAYKVAQCDELVNKGEIANEEIGKVVEEMHAAEMELRRKLEDLTGKRTALINNAHELSSQLGVAINEKQAITDSIEALPS